MKSPCLRTDFSRDMSSILKVMYSTNSFNALISITGLFPPLFFGIMNMFETKSPGVCEQTSMAPIFNRSTISLSIAAISPSDKFLKGGGGLI